MQNSLLINKIDYLLTSNWIMVYSLTRSIYKRPQFAPKVYLGSPNYRIQASCWVSCWSAQQDSVDVQTGPAGRRRAALHDNYSTAHTMVKDLGILWPIYRRGILCPIYRVRTLLFHGYAYEGGGPSGHHFSLAAFRQWSKY